MIGTSMGERLFLRLEEDAVHGPESSAPPGTLAAFPVLPELRSSVAQVLLYREDVPDGTEICERVLPDGAVRIVLDLGSPSSAQGLGGSRALAIGASASPALVRMRGRIEGLSIALRPGAATRLLGVPAGALSEAVVPLHDVWGSGAARLLEDLATAPSDAMRAAVVQAALLRRARENLPAPSLVGRAARLMVSTGGRPSVRAVAAELGVGERRLQQLFYDHVGLSPRAWSRLARLHACLRALRRTEAPCWASLAIDHGFYDQAHLTNELRSLCGLTPTELRRRTISHSSKTPTRGAPISTRTPSGEEGA